ncbi:nuclear transport factor 2 family protein [Nocardioides eburneiflavus]|nr:nuclear transport factor 2 family protein [Nocardioides eburneiflavus]
MPVSQPPTDPTQQIQWLVDRAAISDLLVDFARALDEKDWEGYANHYVDDGVLSFPGGAGHEGRTGMADFAAASLSRYAGTHHLTTNYAISVEGDAATARAYLIAAHIFDAADPTRHADGAGCNNCRLRRTADGWRLTEVAFQVSYLSGEMMFPL